MKDEYAIVLDFLEHGRPGEMPLPLAQVIGESFLNLLEVVIREKIHLKTEDRVYIGDGNRKEVKYIKGRISLNDLTATAKSELDYTLEKIIDGNTETFVKFFNEASPITTRMHSLELLPGIGKKHMWEILNEREEKPFESFEDLKKRVKLLPDPKDMIIKRIKKELSGGVKRYLFVSPPKRSFRP